MATHDSPALQAIADQAYGTAVATNSAYHAGIDDLARYLTGKAPSPRLEAMLGDIAMRTKLTDEYNAYRGPRPIQEP